VAIASHWSGWVLLQGAAGQAGDPACTRFPEGQFSITARSRKLLGMLSHEGVAHRPTLLAAALARLDRGLPPPCTSSLDSSLCSCDPACRSHRHRQELSLAAILEAFISLRGTRNCRVWFGVCKDCAPGAAELLSRKLARVWTELLAV